MQHCWSLSSSTLAVTTTVTLQRATKAVDTSNRRVGGFQFLNTSNATQNLSSVFNQSAGGSQLMGNRVIGYSDFPKEKDMPGVKTLQTYFHYRTYKPGGKN